MSVRTAAVSRTPILDRSRTIAPLGYNRRFVPPAALMVHLCIGQVYATSVYKMSLVEHFHTSLNAVGAIFSIAIATLGISGLVLSSWAERHGPRKAMFVSACCWSSGMLVSALGVHLGYIWLLYLGYGVIGGIGLGLGYTAPVSTLIKWFFDRPGLAAGLAILGFAAGAIVAGPAALRLLSTFDPGFDPGVSGAVADGRALTLMFVTFAVGYFAVMMIGVVTVRLPAPDWTPPSTVVQRHYGRPPAIAGVTARNAIRTPQFWLLWLVQFCNIAAGMALFEQAAPMIQDFFRNSLTDTVSVAGGAAFVGSLSLANMVGRFLWGMASEGSGRKPIFMILLGLQLLIYLYLALFAHTGIPAFVIVCAVLISLYGGGFAIMPAYVKDVFDELERGKIQNRLLTAWAAAGVAGPVIFNRLLDDAGPPGTLTAESYPKPLLLMVFLVGIGFVANYLVSPVPNRLYQSPGRGSRVRVVEGVETQTAYPASIQLAWLVISLLIGYGVIEIVVILVQGGR